MTIKWKDAGFIGGSSITANLRACMLDTGSLIKHLEYYSPEKISLTLEGKSWTKERIKGGL